MTIVEELEASANELVAKSKSVEGLTKEEANAYIAITRVTQYLKATAEY